MNKKSQEQEEFSSHLELLKDLIVFFRKYGIELHLVLDVVDSKKKKIKKKLTPDDKAVHKKRNNIQSQ